MLFHPQIIVFSGMAHLVHFYLHLLKEVLREWAFFLESLISGNNKLIDISNLIMIWNYLYVCVLWLVFLSSADFHNY